MGVLAKWHLQIQTEDDNKIPGLRNPATALKGASLPVVKNKDVEKGS